MLSGGATRVVLDCLSSRGLFSDRLRIAKPIGVVMSGNRVLWGQIILVLAVVLAMNPPDDAMYAPSTKTEGAYAS